MSTDAEFLAGFEKQIDSLGSNESSEGNENTENQEQEQLPTEEPDESVGEEFGEEEPSEGEPTEESSEEDEGTEESDQETEIDYVSAYNELMAPFKANGRQVELRSPEEAKQLMKMGANYTKKMQALGRHRGSVAILERAGISEEQLSFAVDLLQGDPEAIKKLLNDTQIDPLDIDVDSEPVYQENRHVVPTQELDLQEAIQDVLALENGSETIQELNNTWDTASVKKLGEDPSILEVIHNQKQSGVYDIVAKEVERQKSMGLIQVSMPFYDAYNMVGEKLVAQGVLVQENQGQQHTIQQNGKAPLARGMGKQHSSVNPKAQAAGSVRAKPKGNTDSLESLLGLGDEDFLKAMENRV